MLDSKTKRRLVWQLRKRATPAEKQMCKVLGKHRIKYVFQRAFRIKGNKYKKIPGDNVYIVDFYLPEYATVIEIDGGVHNDRYEYDRHRSFELKFTTKAIHNLLRFSNSDVLKAPNKVIQAILRLEKTRFVKGLRAEERNKRKAVNQSIADSNEIRSMVNRDPSLLAWEKRRLLKESSI